MTNKELADWIDENIDSHGIYDAGLLEQLDPQDAAVVPTQTRAEVAESIRRRGLGGNLDADGPEPLFTGHVAAEALCDRRLGRLPEKVTRLSGRGSIFRECVKALRETPDVDDSLIQRFPITN